MNKQQLASLIWDTCNDLRGSISAVEYKDIILGFIFYRFVSENEVAYLMKQDWTMEIMAEELTEEDSETVKQCREHLGYFIAYKNLFSTWKNHPESFTVSNVTDALNAFVRNNQLSKYMQHGVFTGFFSLVQVFVAMTPEETLYFANPGRDRAFNSDYYFHWGDFNNRYINDWEEIAEKFLSIPMAHRLIGYGTIADGTDNILKVMRSYQYHAAYKIYSQVVKRIDWDDGQQKGGYVYHTTGSGKTMTSFKCAQLIKSSGKVDKIVFLMDRDELWKQTYDNYRNFSDCDDIEDTENTNSLLSKLENDTPNLLVVTSIQKMSNLTTVTPTPLAARIAKVQKKKLVFIIDEAHRSTFGTMLRDIKETYPKALFFGFTGTPILDVNSINGITTDGLFGECLHKYTITEGIRDKNVLGFKPSKVVTFDEEDFRSKVALSINLSKL